MPRTNLGGNDPDHDLPTEEEDRLERKLREEPRKLLALGKVQHTKKLLNRARNISRRPSKRSEHH